MARPQQPELSRSAKTDLTPPDNQPGHHPAKEQDKPDLDAFAAKLGTDPKAPSATSARKPGRPKSSSPKSAPAKSTESKSAPAKSTPNTAGPAKASSRPAAAAGIQSPAASAKIETTPAQRPATAPVWPESAPAADDLGPLDEQPPTHEPLMVSLAMLPLRETVRQLERLERRLTERLMNR